MTSREHLSDSIKKQVAGKQKYKCANNTEIELYGLKGYICPRWDSQYYAGDFDEAGYDIDHIEEYCLTQDHNIENLQALCKSCHSVKTKRFMNRHKKVKKTIKEVKKVKKMDIYERFLDECTEEIEGEKNRIDDVYKAFKKWFSGNNPGMCPGKRTMISGLRKYKKISRMTINKKWIMGIDGLKIKNNELDF